MGEQGEERGVRRNGSLGFNLHGLLLGVFGVACRMASG